MSSTLHFALVREPRLLDIVDEEWARDVLPDDEIALPAGVKELPEDGEEEDSSGEVDPRGWDELGLASLS